MNEINDLQSVLDAGAAIGEPRRAEGDYAIMPEGYNLHDLEKYQPVPHRKRGHIITTDTPSFILMANRHGSEDDTVIYANVNYEKSHYALQAVIDDHKKDGPQWREFDISLEPALSMEWRTWTDNNKKAMPQAEFAAFLEDNLSDIASMPGMPTGSEMLQMAIAFQMNSEKRFKKVIDLQSGGYGMEFVDQADNDTSTKMQAFKRFTIGVPVFQNAKQGYPVEARLKFRATGDSLRFCYELVRPDRVFKEAVDDQLAEIGEATKLPIVFGRP